MGAQVFVGGSAPRLHVSWLQAYLRHQQHLPALTLPQMCSVCVCVCVRVCWEVGGGGKQM